MVYFVRIPDGRIKIGVTQDFFRRRDGLAERYGDPITLLALIPGWECKEKELHRKFAAIRHGRTELFDPSPKLLRFIEHLPQPVIRNVDHARLTHATLDYGQGGGRDSRTDKLFSHRRLEELLGVHRMFLAGLIDGMSIPTKDVRNARMIDEDGLVRLRARLEEIKAG